jgi:hypothetical protein
MHVDPTALRLAAYQRNIRSAADGERIIESLVAR